ncbi:unnamed protein product, partial [Larinioides sclopetarius]
MEVWRDEYRFSWRLFIRPRTIFHVFSFIKQSPNLNFSFHKIFNARFYKI